MAAAALITTAGLQLVLPLPTNLPSESALVPRRAREAAPPVSPDFPAVLANPIFAPDRKPDASAIPVAGGMNGFVALGVGVAGDKATAVVRGPGAAIQRLKPGDEIQGWKLVVVETDRLTFERNQERRVLMIQKGVAPLAPAAQGAMSKNSDKSDDDSGDNDDN